MEGITVTRYLFIVFNTFHIVLGVLLTTFGFWLQYASPIREALNSDSTSLSVIHFTIALGCFLLVFGGCGAFADVYTNKKILALYLGFNVVMVILEIAVIAYGYSQRDTQQTHVNTVWVAMPIVYQYVLQDRFNCCGLTGPAEITPYYHISCLPNATLTSVPWPTGCRDSLLYWFDQNVNILAVMIGLLLVASLLQVIMCAKLLYNNIRRGRLVHDENKNDSDYDDDDGVSTRSRSSKRIKQNYEHLG